MERGAETKHAVLVSDHSDHTNLLRRATEVLQSDGYPIVLSYPTVHPNKVLSADLRAIDMGIVSVFRANPMLAVRAIMNNKPMPVVNFSPQNGGATYEFNFDQEGINHFMDLIKSLDL